MCFPVYQGKQHTASILKPFGETLLEAARQTHGLIEIFPVFDLREVKRVSMGSGETFWFAGRWDSFSRGITARETTILISFYLENKKEGIVIIRSVRRWKTSKAADEHRYIVPRNG